MADTETFYYIDEDGVQDEILRLFSVEVTKSGVFLAVSDKTPMFCFSGNTIEEVVQKASEALDFYNQRLK